jgi:hypothetical protein
MKCAGCETETLIEGAVTDSQNGDVTFRPTGSSRLARMFGVGGHPARAYACPGCGRLEFVVDFTEDERRKYRAFEGRQPGVLDRIGGEDAE